ncbi:2-dehydro-3-deoxygluconokinase [Enterococcus sp. PF1-24]|uniref:sugar kinase n=1 Tax=unclassified Enterococcus TaxID=2608891 RepID=UPI002475AAE8|nr:MULTISPECIES: sugar kinase [unclassified Enterococcus]MDH6363980.1 2-dehydro-3-deoxygluconokinase [Enterococcus sp. PFB1-1]MDH6401081.1 2-dehydro-3-deoxygluconokinase [Enterococcus sp. PF1-24]
MAKIVTLGEIMLRLSSLSGQRIPQSETFQAHYGGGEANVAVSLANYGHEVYFASKVPENDLGEAVDKHLRRYGVSSEFVLTGGKRLGTYYLETGVAGRGASVIYDRAASSFAEMTELEWDLAKLFKNATIFHISGITPALSEAWQQLTIALIKKAKAAGCKISFDVNYRGKLWGQQAAAAFLKQVLPLVDYCSAGKMDALYLLGIPEVNGKSENEALVYYYQEMQRQYPNIQVFYSTLREVRSASANCLQGTLWQNQQYHESQIHEIEPIVDRVGGGDAFAGGVLHGLATGLSSQETIDFATAAAVLKHTVHGDCNQFSQQEVLAFLAAGSGRIVR